MAIEEALVDSRLPLLYTQGLSPHHERTREHSGGHARFEVEVRAGGRLEPLHNHGGPGHHMRHGHGRDRRRAKAKFSIRQRVVRVSFWIYK